MNEALLVIDMQKHFNKGFAGQSMKTASVKINETLSLCRSKGIPIVWIQHANKKMGLIEGGASFELLDSLRPGKDEIRITKTFGNAFRETKLEGLLKERGIEKLYLCGFAAEGCVHRSYKGAKELGYSALKIEDALASSSKLLLKVFEKLGDRITAREVENQADSRS